VKLHEIFIDPAEVFSRIDERPTWLGPFLAVSLVAMLTLLLSAPIGQQLALRHLPNGAGEEVRAELFRILRVSTYYSVAVTPILILLKWSVLAALLFLILILSGADISYRKTLALLGHASLVVSLDSLLSVLIMYVRGLDNILSPADVQSTVLSLSSFLSVALHPALRVALDNLSVFTLWYLVLLIFGVASVARLDRWRAAFIVTLLWGLQTLFLAGIAMIFSRYTELSV
jgi:hypothetical protein